MAKKVLLIGWDSADWKIINPLMEAGQMPALEKFINAGVMGNIATLRPIISPILWNSIATGKLPHKHGIHGFAEPLPDGSGIRPISSASRKAKAIWNILTQAGLRSHVVGWFASHPAEAINGVCVSNQFFASSSPPGKALPIPKQSVHPETLAETLAEFRVHPSEIDSSHVQPLIPRGSEIDQTNPVEQKRLHALRSQLAQCASVHSVATWLMQNEPWDFTAIYYEAMDLVSHYFMPFHPPRMNGVPEREFEIYKDVVRGIYRFHDMMLERLVQLAGEDCTVILMSDHGFHSDHLRPKVPERMNDPVGWHRSHGIFCMKGSGVLADERIYGASLLDIAPTILTLFDLPVGEDMDGKALVQSFAEVPEVKRIPSWESVSGDCGMLPKHLQHDTITSQEAIQQLIDLGYLQAPSDDIQKNVKRIVDDLQSNLGISHLNYGDAREAITIFSRLFSEHPDDLRYGLSLAHAHFALNQLPAVRNVLEKILKADPTFSPAQIMMGSLLLAEGKLQAAIAQLAEAEKANPDVPQLHNRLGGAYLRTRQWNAAERAFRKVLEIEPDNAEACNGLSIAVTRQRKLDEAVELSLRAVGLQHFFPAAHFQLGSVLARLNQPERAALAFEHGLSMKPGSLVAHRYLARLYYRLGDFRKCHEHHEAISRFKEKQDALPKSD